MRTYPSRRGLPISPDELGFTTLRVEAESRAALKDVNLHHNAWTKRYMARTLISQTFRDLEGQQFIMPIDEHLGIHQEYDPPRVALHAMYAYVHEAHERGERLQYGTARLPLFGQLSRVHMLQIDQEYRRLEI